MTLSRACAPYSWGWIGPQLYGRSAQIQWRTWRRISISVGQAKKHANEPAPSTNNEYGPISHHPYPFLVLGPILLPHGFPGLGFTLGTRWATMVFNVHCVQTEKSWPSRQNVTKKQNDRSRLVHSEKLAVLKQYMRNVAHPFNTCFAVAEKSATRWMNLCTTSQIRTLAAEDTELGKSSTQQILSTSFRQVAAKGRPIWSCRNKNSCTTNWKLEKGLPSGVFLNFLRFFLPVGICRGWDMLPFRNTCNTWDVRLSLVKWNLQGLMAVYVSRFMIYVCRLMVLGFYGLRDSRWMVWAFLVWGFFVLPWFLGSRLWV